MFWFDNKNNIETLGIATGTKIAPTYATLSLAYITDNLYEVIEIKYNKNIFLIISSWKK